MIKRAVVTVALALAALADVAGAADVSALVSLHASAEVDTPEVLLAQVAEIEAAPELARALAAVSLGSAPVTGSSRSIESGYVILRLRRYGINCSAVTVRGEGVTVTRPAAALAHEASSTPVPADPKALAPEPPLIRRGQLVEVRVQCGGVAVTASGVASGDAGMGELVAVRLPNNARPLVARVTGRGRAVFLITESM